MDVDDVARAAVGMGVHVERVVAALAVDDMAEQSAAQPPLVEGGVTENAHGLEAVFPRGPALAVEAVGELGRKLGPLDEGEGRAAVDRRILHSEVSAKLGPFARPPCRGDADVEITRLISARKVDVLVERNARRDAELPIDRQLCVQVDAVLALARVEHAGQYGLRSNRAQRQLDDASGRGESIALRGEADADRGPGLDPLIANDDSAHVEAVDADIASRYGAEAANFIGAVEADRLIADAGAEGVVGRRDGILAGPLSNRGSDGAGGGKQGHERLSQ